MSKLDWVKWEAGKFLGGVIGMSIEEIGVYSVVLNLIYDHGGPIKDDRERIARRCGMRPTSFEKVFRSLLEAGKLVVNNGLISNEKAVAVLETRTKVVEKWSKNLQAAKTKVDEIFNDVKGDTYTSAAAGDVSASPVESESVDKKKRKKDSMSASRKAKADVVDYPEEFEKEIWAPYPRKAGTSKKGAWNQWRMLSDENQARVKAAIPLYAAMMRKEGRDDSKICHLEFFISRRIYETIAVTPAQAQASNVVRIPWHKTATRDQWERVLKMYEANNSWRPTWGPAPGFADCAMPTDLIDKLPYHLNPKNDRRFMASKHAVDTTQPAVP